MTNGSKRAREEDPEGEEAGDAKAQHTLQEEDAEGRSVEAQTVTASAAADLEEEEEDEDRIYMPTSTSRASMKQGKECPYLDTISRQV